MNVNELTRWAASESERLLGSSGARWRHVQGVVAQATAVAGILPPEDEDVFVAAAYLHDIGYAAELRRSGAHQLDGARHLRNLGRERLACLVAHHSEASYELKARGLAAELGGFPREESATADALTYCDLQTGPTGKPTSLSARVADVEARYGEGLVVDALRQALPALRAAIARTDGRLRAAGRRVATG